MRQLVLIMLAGHALSNQVKTSLESVKNVIPKDVLITYRYTLMNDGTVGVPKLPALLFKVNEKLVYRLEGIFTSSDILEALRSLG